MMLHCIYIGDIALSVHPSIRLGLSIHSPILSHTESTYILASFPFAESGRFDTSAYSKHVSFRVKFWVTDCCYKINKVTIFIPNIFQCFRAIGVTKATSTLNTSVKLNDFIFV